MKNVLVFLILALSSVFHMAAAIEPSVVVVTTEEALVYRVSADQVELKERLPRKDAPGKTQQDQALEELADRRRLAAAYVANFLDCGQDVSTTASLKEWVQQETASTAKVDGRIRNLVAKRVSETYIMVSHRGGEGAVVLDLETGRRLPGSPCGAAVKFVRISPGGHRLAIAAEELKKITFYGGKENLSWGSPESSGHFIQLHQLRATSNPIRTSTITETPLDLLLPDEGNWWVLVAKYSFKWWNPANWLYAAGGHVTRGAELSMLTYASSAQLLGSRHVVSGVELGAGRLVASE
ncbi:hypothetical protein [Herbaspirillum sp. SJZ107]|uniref:hypothetical protein n=1 Tax=Herbaspirillum sp. SJZ107 TaxID=2572881 RepID=UPI0011530A49|nr:hypothetical protein [Herbaspirillum sp. SJZ107]TQK10633.1 hypothetical protein FBX97_0552 [Herbaspirillum sp. SJZ107]